MFWKVMGSPEASATKATNSLKVKDPSQANS